MPFIDALKTFDRAAHAEHYAAGERERAAILERFPLEAWPTLPLSRYALGQGDKDVYSYWIEFGANHLGSMRGGSARKHAIYKQRDGQWFFYDHHPDVESAWSALRAGFVRAFELAKQGKWNEIDAVEETQWCPALLAKSLHVYFPNDILPIVSRDHLQHFLDVLGRRGAAEGASEVIRFNRATLDALRSYRELADFSTVELERLLYRAADPREAKRVLKVAPGDEAKFWEDCRRHGYVCVGWDEVGDLRQYDGKVAFRAAFGTEFSEFYKQRQQMVSRKANELWRLFEVEPGDIIIANRGTKEVLAVGTVIEPGYEFQPERKEYQHCVHVAWDESYRQSLDPPQGGWGVVTVAEVPASLYEKILARAGTSTETPRQSVPVDVTLTRLSEALDRKGQAILYGPPGTGKTYAARRFAVWWLLKHQGDSNPTAILANPEAFANAERTLATPPPGEAGDVAALTRISFHASYSYEDFIEGFRPIDSGQGLVLRLEDGVFKRVCVAAKRNPKRRYLVLVDEINRANVAKVMGELLTLLERDKRGLTITLPQSKQPFEVPPNVHLLGTMNTADRSITLLDAALRRRFAFIELMPDTTMLEGARIQNLELDAFLDTLNARVMRSPGGGREKQIGHAYLLEGTVPIRDAAELARRFHQEILPLLQEYCFDDYRVLASYLGSEIVDVDNQCLGRDAHDPTALLEHLEREFMGEVDETGA